MRSLAGVLAVLALPASAPAATMASRPDCGVGGDCPLAMQYVAEPGEANDVLARMQPGVVIVHDAGASVRAGEGCTQLDPNSVRCVDNGPFSIETHDGDDRVRAERFASVRLGDGDDGFAGMGVAEGGAGNDRLEGGSGGENLDGGPGDDVLLGGDGPDQLAGGPGADRLDGGGGVDKLSFSGEPDGVVLDLLGPGSDVVSGVEDLTGTRGADRLSGDDGPNVIEAGPGGDSLEGRGGIDRLSTTGRGSLSGGAGDDVLLGSGSTALDGGPGDDELSVAGGRVREVPRRCGPGRDLLGGSPLRLPLDCELLGLGGRRFIADAASARRSGARVLLVQVRCPGRCGGAVRIGPARWRLRVPLAGWRSVRVRLPAAARGLATLPLTLGRSRWEIVLRSPA